MSDPDAATTAARVAVRELCGTASRNGDAIVAIAVHAARPLIDAEAAARERKRIRQAITDFAAALGYDLDGDTANDTSQ